MKPTATLWMKATPLLFVTITNASCVEAVLEFVKKYRDVPYTAFHSVDLTPR